MTSRVDELLAVVDAARAYLHALAASELPPDRVLRMARTASTRASALLARCGHDPASLRRVVPPRAGLVGREDTDELIGRALGEAFDDGPEGPGDSGALVTDETGEVPLVSGLDDPPGTADLRRLDDDDEVTLKSPEPTVPSDGMPPFRPEEIAGAGLVAEVVPPPGGSARVPFAVDEAPDDPSAREVIVTKEDAVREVEALRASLPPGRPPSPPAEDDALAAMDTLHDDEEEPDEEPTAEVEPASEAPAPTRGAEPVSAAAVSGPRVAPAPKIRGPGGAAIGGLGAPGALPTIRDGSTPKPRAAAIQLGADGEGGTVLGEEEELEPIAIGGVEDEDEYDFDSDQGFGLHVEEYEEYEDDEEDEEPEEEAPAEAPAELPTVDVPEVLEQAVQAVQAGDLERGIDLYSDVLDVDPENVVALVGRGKVHLDLGDFARAMSDFTIAQELAPEDPEPRIAMGDLYFARKDYRRAIELFDDALEAAPDHAMAHCRRGISHYYRKNYREAFDDLTRARQLDPDIPNIDTYVAMARKRLRR